MWARVLLWAERAAEQQLVEAGCPAQGQKAQCEGGQQEVHQHEVHQHEVEQHVAHQHWEGLLVIVQHQAAPILPLLQLLLLLLLTLAQEAPPAPPFSLPPSCSCDQAPCSSFLAAPMWNSAVAQAGPPHCVPAATATTPAAWRAGQAEQAQHAPQSAAWRLVVVGVAGCASAGAPSTA